MNQLRGMYAVSGEATLPKLSFVHSEKKKKKKKKKRSSLRWIKFKSPLSSWHNRIKDTIKETQANN